MSKTWLVLKNEFLTVVRRPSFILTLFLIPVTGIGIMLLAGFLQSRQNPVQVTNIFIADEGTGIEGFVDESRLVATIPAELQETLRAFPTRADALQAVSAGEIDAFYVIAPDYLESGQVTYYRQDFNPLAGLDRSEAVERLMTYNLASGDPDLAARLLDPVNLKKETLSGSVQRDMDNPMNFFIPYAIVMLFYITILTSSSLMLSSLTTEKQNRVMEILMTTTAPMQLLTGKIIALGAVGLIQTLVWSASGLVLLATGAASFKLLAEVSLPPVILLWGAVFFLLGYGVYASLMAGVGALVPSMREASQLATVVILPLIVPMVLINNLMNAPNGTLSVVLSLVPFTSPVVMMARLAAGGVVWWHLVVSIVLLLGTIYLLLRSVAGMFRAQNLLSGASVNLKIFLKALIGRA